MSTSEDKCHHSNHPPASLPEHDVITNPKASRIQAIMKKYNSFSVNTSTLWDQRYLWSVLCVSFVLLSCISTCMFKENMQTSQSLNTEKTLYCVLVKEYLKIYLPWLSKAKKKKSLCLLFSKESCASSAQEGKHRKSLVVFVLILILLLFSCIWRHL